MFKNKQQQKEAAKLIELETALKVMEAMDQQKRQTEAADEAEAAAKIERQSRKKAEAAVAAAINQQQQKAEEVAALAEATRLQEAEEAAEAVRLKEAEDVAALAEAKRLKEAEEAEELERLKEAKDAAALIQQQKEIDDADKRVNYEYKNVVNNNFRQEDITKFFEEINIYKEKINANKIFLNNYEKEINILEKLQKFVQKKVEEIRAEEAAEVEAKEAEIKRQQQDAENLKILLEEADGEVETAYSNAINNITEENIKNFNAKIEKIKKIDYIHLYDYTDKINYINNLLEEQKTKLQIEQLKKEISEITYDAVINDNDNDNILLSSFIKKISKFNTTGEVLTDLANLIKAKFEEMHLIKLSIDEADAEVTAAYKIAITNVTEENIKIFYVKINAVNEIFTVNKISKSIDYTEKIKKLKKKIKKEITNEINKFVVLNDENYEIIKAKIQNLTEFFNENEKAELYNLLDAKKNKLQIEGITKEISELTYDDVIMKQLSAPLLSKIGQLSDEKDQELLKKLLFKKSAEKNLIKTSIDSADAEVTTAFKITMANVTEEKIKNFYEKIEAVNKIFTENQISKSINYDYAEKIKNLNTKITEEITKEINEFTVLTDYETIQAKIENLTKFNDNNQQKTKLNNLLDDKYTKLQVEHLEKEISELTYDVVINDIYKNDNNLQDYFYEKIRTFQISNEEKISLNQMLSTKYEEKNQIKKNIDSADEEVTAAYDEAMANATKEKIENLEQKINAAYEIFEQNGKPGYKDYSEYKIRVEIKILDDKLAEEERKKKEAEDIINEQQRQVEQQKEKEAKLKAEKKAEKAEKIREQKKIIDNETFAELNKIIDGTEINGYADGLTEKSNKLVQDANNIEQLKKLSHSFTFETGRNQSRKFVDEAREKLIMANTQAFITISEIKRIVRSILLQIYDNYLEKSQIEKKNNINFEDFSEINQETILNLNKIFKPIYKTADELQDEAITAKEKINRINKERKNTENKDKTQEEKIKIKKKRRDDKNLKKEIKQREITNEIQVNNYKKKEEFEKKKREKAELEIMQSQQRAIDSAKKIKEFLDIEIETRNNEALDYQFKKLSNLYNKNENKNIQAIADIFKEYSETIAKIKEKNRLDTEEKLKNIEKEKENIKKKQKKLKKLIAKNNKNEQRRKDIEKKDKEKKLQETEINLSKITNEKKNQTYCITALASASYPLLLFAAIGATDSLRAIPEFFSGEVGTVFLNCASLFTTYNILMGYIRNWYIDENKIKITKILEELIGKTEKEKENIYNALDANDRKLIDDLEKNMHQAIGETAELETLN